MSFIFILIRKKIPLSFFLLLSISISRRNPQIISQCYNQWFIKSKYSRIWYRRYTKILLFVFFISRITFGSFNPLLLFTKK
ncbi:hypothetical protein BDA99DRAFT_526542 [Phascolomyces articulosus]|uniref:Uncharacterized protein n=1 Tax=Phascolomyces articulosus TaxID=60185 RepID=A0AAD5JYN4_9FUNG|nr:hypothetical protein BDA99DRAFT_526542 [Phascolomyces articulosus]